MRKRRDKAAAGSATRKDENLLIRLQESEKAGFKMAADIAGQSLSVWVRDRLRRAAQAELESAGTDIPFLPKRRGVPSQPSQPERT
jgi:hypothetical protein